MKELLLGAFAFSEVEAPADSAKKTRNRNTDKWELVDEWDAAQVENDRNQQKLLTRVTDVNLAAGLDRFPVHKDRTAGLHALTYNTTWSAKKGLDTKDMYECPLKMCCKCKCQFHVCLSIMQIQLYVKLKHTAASHVKDKRKGLTDVQRKTIEQAVQLALLQ